MIVNKREKRQAQSNPYPRTQAADCGQHTQYGTGEQANPRCTWLWQLMQRPLIWRVERDAQMR